MKRLSNSVGLFGIFMQNCIKTNLFHGLETQIITYWMFRWKGNNPQYKLGLWCGIYWSNVIDKWLATSVVPCTVFCEISLLVDAKHKARFTIVVSIHKARVTYFKVLYIT